jgi:hypothetical protein
MYHLLFFSKERGWAHLVEQGEGHRTQRSATTLVKLDSVPELVANQVARAV